MTPHQLINIRAHTKLTREEFAEKLGFTIHAIQSKEIGRRSITKRDEKLIVKMVKMLVVLKENCGKINVFASRES